ncbi:MAG: hypothetical protein JSU04_04505 [Bdellovibrionales bacterium]|nr:hypothetical protein [Bdellovibrionales bacterium]
MAAEESVTNYFSYVKNVLGVKTLQSARIRQSLLESVETEIPTTTADLLFLNLKQASDQSVFASETSELLDKMIQAMRLGNRQHLILEADLMGSTETVSQILQKYTAKVTTPFVVVFSSKPVKPGMQNMGTVKFLETYGPSYLLQNANAKKLVWADLQKVMKEIGVV